MTTDPVHVDQGVYLDLLGDLLKVAIIGRLRGISIRPPVRRLVGNPEGAEDLFVEVVTAGETLGNSSQKQP